MKGKFELFMSMLKSMGGSYQAHVPEPDAKKPWQADYEPAHKIRQRSLNPKRYYTDVHGSIRKRKEVA